MGGSIPKQFAIVGGEPLLTRTVNNFAAALPTAKLVVVLPAGQADFWRNLSARFPVAKHMLAEGGKERFHSVKNGLAALDGMELDLIAVQDGVRPFASAEMIRRAVDCAKENGTAIPVVRPVDSFRRIEGDGSIPEDRSSLRIIQTPQVFDAEMLRKAYDTAYDKAFTDDASVVEHAGHRITLCEGERTNIKITTPEDIVFAEAIAGKLRERE